MGLISINGVETLIFHRGQELHSLDEISKLNVSKFVVLFHGYGANAWDLSIFSKFYDQMYNGNSENILWFFPQGILSLAMGFFDGGQRAWFPITVDRLLRQKENDPDVLSKERIDRGDELLSLLSSFFKNLRKFGNQELVLGGFSQGGMVSYHLLPLIVEEWKINIFALFSTLSIEFNRFDPLWRKCIQTKLPFLLQSHGKTDDILPYQEGRNLFLYLSSYFHNHEFISFESGHTVPELVINKFFKYL